MVFHGGTIPRLKDFILGGLGDSDGMVRVVFATGMGSTYSECPDNHAFAA